VFAAEEREQDDTTGPDINGGGLVGEVEEGFGGHVAFGAGAVFDFHGFLELHDFKDFGVFFGVGVAGVAVLVDFDFGEAKVDEEAGAGFRVVEEVGGFDVTMHDAHA